MDNWSRIIFSDDIPFGEKLQRVFSYQFKHNEVYRRFCVSLSAIDAEGDSGDPDVESIGDRFLRDPGSIPLLPVRAFKDSSPVCNTEKEADLVFKSSGSRGMERSIHPVMDEELYRRSILQGFSHFYHTEDATFLGYTPGYSDNPDSSLIWMIRELIKRDESGMSRFLPLDEPLSQDAIDQIQREERRLFLFGAAFGLLDLAEISKVKLPSDSVVLETGGMKTRRREMDRMSMHRRLARDFGLHESRIHSEYGMAELLSQAYATGGKWFRSPPWMKVEVVNPDNPRETLPPYTEGKIGVIDLANVHSCAFLLTGDRGIADRDGRFQVLGRWNPKDLRGCNFLIDED